MFGTKTGQKCQLTAVIQEYKNDCRKEEWKATDNGDDNVGSACGQTVHNAAAKIIGQAAVDT